LRVLPKRPCRGGGGLLAPLDATRDEMPVAELLRRAEQDEGLDAVAVRPADGDRHLLGPPTPRHARSSSAASIAAPVERHENRAACARPSGTSSARRETASRIPPAIACTSSGSTPTAASPSASASGA